MSREAPKRVLIRPSPPAGDVHARGIRLSNVRVKGQWPTTSSGPG